MIRRPSPGFACVRTGGAPAPSPAPPPLVPAAPALLSPSPSDSQTFTGGSKRPLTLPVRSRRSCSRSPLRGRDPQSGNAALHALWRGAGVESIVQHPGRQEHNRHGINHPEQTSPESANKPRHKRRVGAGVAHSPIRTPTSPSGSTSSAAMNRFDMPDDRAFRWYPPIVWEAPASAPDEPAERRMR